MTLHPQKSSRLEQLQPIAHRVAKNHEIISRTNSTKQNSAHGICDEYWVINNMLLMRNPVRIRFA